MATLTTQQITLSGLDARYAAVSDGGDRFTPGSNVFLHFINGGTPSTATVVMAATVLGRPVAGVAVDVPAGEERFVGPFQRQHFAGTGGLADVTYSSTATLTVAVVRL